MNELTVEHVEALVIGSGQTGLSVGSHLARRGLPFLIVDANEMGRKARPKVLSKGEPLIRTKPKDLRRAGVERVPRVVGARDGRPYSKTGRQPR